MKKYQDQLRELSKENLLLKQLGTTEGFYSYYFSQLGYHRTNVECFNMVNDLHLDLFGELRYSSWHSFKQTRYYRNSTKK